MKLNHVAPDTEPDVTGSKQAASRFKPGQSGNPAGRPKGSRNKLAADFISALHDDFADHGAAAIERVRKEKPDIYMRVVAGILPKELDVALMNVGAGLDDLQDARDFAAAYRQLRQMIGAEPILIEQQLVEVEAGDD